MELFVHPHGICETTKIGIRTQVAAFAHILERATIGKDCNISSHVFVSNDVTLGDRVTLKSGVHILDGVHLEDDVRVEANATLLSGVSIGKKAVVGAAAVVTRSVPPNAIVEGHPAHIVGYINSTREATVFSADKPLDAGENAAVMQSKVRGVTFHRLARHLDMRGELTVAEFIKEIPFTPRRIFAVFNVPTEEVRGEHAHRECHQFLVCIKGSCCVVADDGESRQEFRLDRPNLGVYLPPMIWGVQYKYTRDSILLVLASHYYESSDYIRDYGQYIETLQMRKQ